VRLYKAVSDNSYSQVWNKTWSHPATVAVWLEDLGVGDHDGDGKAELIFNEYSNGAVATKVYERP
jgi:hypothetical protein